MESQIVFENTQTLERREGGSGKENTRKQTKLRKKFLHISRENVQKNNTILNIHNLNFSCLCVQYFPR